MKRCIEKGIFILNCKNRYLHPWGNIVHSRSSQGRPLEAAENRRDPAPLKPGSFSQKRVRLLILRVEGPLSGNSAGACNWRIRLAAYEPFRIDARDRAAEPQPFPGGYVPGLFHAILANQAKAWGAKQQGLRSIALHGSLATEQAAKSRRKGSPISLAYCARLWERHRKRRYLEPALFGKRHPASR